MFHLVSLLIALYVVARLILPLRLPAWSRCLLAVLALIASQNRLICLLLFGNMFSPELPGWIISAAGVVFGTLLFAFFVGVLGELVALLTLAAKGRATAATVLKRWRPLALVAGATLAMVGTWEGQRVPQVKDVQVAIDDLPPALQGYRIIQLTDLHVGRVLGSKWLRQVVSNTNAAGGDLVLITGDLIDGTVARREKDIVPLADLRAPDGVVASLGNHEYYFGALPWTDKFGELGLTVLRNSHMTVTRGNANLVIAGTVDEAASARGAVGPDVAGAVGSAAPQDVVVLMRHRPTGLEEAQRAGVDLQLSGHTHGGMIVGADQIVKAANGGFVSGAYRVGSTQLYVSNGTGIWNGFALRLGRRPEITRLTLVSAKG